MAAEPADTDVLLRFDRVSVVFDDVKALDGISFEVRPAQTKVVLGAAGSGKTTLLKVAIGLIRPSSGKVFLFGREIERRTGCSIFGYRLEGSGPG